MSIPSSNNTSRVIPNVFGRWFALQRAIAGDTQESFRKKIDGPNDNTSISSWERGNGLPEVQKLATISRIYSIPSEQVVAHHAIHKMLHSELVDYLFLKEVQIQTETILKGVVQGITANPLGSALKLWRGNQTILEIVQKTGISKNKLWSYEGGDPVPLDALKILTSLHNEELIDTISLSILSQTIHDYGNLGFDLSQMFWEAALAFQSGIREMPQANPVGEILKTWRGERGQEEVAELLKLTRGTLSSYERGTVLVPLAVLNTLANHGVRPLSELITLSAITQAVAEYGDLPIDFSHIFSEAASLCRSSAPSDRLNLFGNLLKQLRGEEAFLKVAAKVGITPRAFLLLEKGTFLPETRTLMALANSFNLPIATLIAYVTATRVARAAEQVDSNLNATAILESGAIQCETCISNVSVCNSFGKYLTTLRGEMGISEFAQKIGVSHPSMVRFEAGEQIPELPLLEIIVQCLSTTIEKLIAFITVDRAHQAYGHLGIDFEELFMRTSIKAEEKIESIQMLNSLGEALKKMRGKKTHREIAESVGLDPSFLSELGNGNVLLSLDNLRNLANYFEVPITDLIPYLIADQMVKTYGFMQVDLSNAARLAFALLPERLFEPLLSTTMNTLQRKSSNLLGEKIAALIEEQGLCLGNKTNLGKITSGTGIEWRLLDDLIHGKIAWQEFVYQIDDPDSFRTLASITQFSPLHLTALVGIDLVLQKEAFEKRRPEYVSYLTKGYDIESFDPSNHSFRKIEVKAFSEIELGISFTRSEWMMARALKDDYYFSLIINAIHPYPTIVTIKNPASQLEANSINHGRDFYVGFWQITRLVENRGFTLNPSVTNPGYHVVNV